jgi:hypothetical protein
VSKRKSKKKFEPTKVATLNSMRDEIVAKRKQEAQIFKPNILSLSIKAVLQQWRQGIY